MGNVLASAEVIRGQDSETKPIMNSRFSTAEVKRPGSMNGSGGGKFQKKFSTTKTVVKRREQVAAPRMIRKSGEKSSEETLQKYPVVTVQNPKHDE